MNMAINNAWEKDWDEVLEFPPIDWVDQTSIDPDVQEWVITYRDKLLWITKEKPVDFKDIKLFW